MKLSRFALTAALFLMVVGVPRESEAFLIPSGTAAQDLVDKFLLERLKKEKLPANNDTTIRNWAYNFVYLYNANAPETETDENAIKLFMTDFYAPEDTGMTDVIPLLHSYLDTLSPRIRYAFTAVLENNLKSKSDTVSKQIVKMATTINRDLAQKYLTSRGIVKQNLSPEMEPAD